MKIHLAGVSSVLYSGEPEWGTGVQEDKEALPLSFWMGDSFQRYPTWHLSPGTHGTDYGLIKYNVQHAVMGA